MCGLHLQITNVVKSFYCYNLVKQNYVHSSVGPNSPSYYYCEYMAVLVVAPAVVEMTVVLALVHRVESPFFVAQIWLRLLLPLFYSNSSCLVEIFDH